MEPSRAQEVRMTTHKSQDRVLGWDERSMKREGMNEEEADDG